MSDYKREDESPLEEALRIGSYPEMVAKLEKEVFYSHYKENQLKERITVLSGQMQLMVADKAHIILLVKELLNTSKSHSADLALVKILELFGENVNKYKRRIKG